MSPLTVEQCGLEVVRASPGCECHFGHATYVRMFPPEYRERIFSMCGPHPTIYALRMAVMRCGLVEDYPVEWRIAKGHAGVVLFYDETASLSTSFRGIASRDYGPDWVPLWSQAALSVLATPRCVPFGVCFTPELDGFCYLDLYPRYEWQRLGRMLGPWPELQALPSGRFPASSVAAVATFARGMVERLAVHCQRLPSDQRKMVDALAAYPGSVVVGGREFPARGAPSPPVLQGGGSGVVNGFGPDTDVLYVRGHSGQKIPGVSPSGVEHGGTLKRHDLGEPGGGYAVDGDHWVLMFSPGAVVVFGHYRLVCERQTVMFGKGEFAFRLPVGTSPTVEYYTSGVWAMSLVENLGLDYAGIALRLAVRRGAGVLYRSATWSLPTLGNDGHVLNTASSDTGEVLTLWSADRTYDIKDPGKFRLAASHYGYVAAASDRRLRAGALEVCPGGCAALFPCRASLRVLGTGESRVSCEFLPDDARPPDVAAMTALERVGAVVGMVSIHGIRHGPKRSGSITVVEDASLVSHYGLSKSDSVLDLSAVVESAGDSMLLSDDRGPIATHRGFDDWLSSFSPSDPRE